MGWRVGVTSGCSKYGISHIEQQRKVIYINNLIIFIVFIIFHNVVDSKWTLTVCGWLLKKNGAMKVFPFCLADSSREEEG